MHVKTDNIPLTIKINLKYKTRNYESPKIFQHLMFLFDPLSSSFSLLSTGRMNLLRMSSMERVEGLLVTTCSDTRTCSSIGSTCKYSQYQ
ncbi:hypothetical protein VIGAN_04280600 [Vigna angularis var. angularis]|uniref:Uncharacterized protein n=1 Tax=Vigna angularis var. angularis TaxID=157739 RepID=A0A0S3RXF6_PHAAN|nr:hypothetical protein VIGAN_04280600 [Vigna angularis var. angularis]